MYTMKEKAERKKKKKARIRIKRKWIKTSGFGSDPKEASTSLQTSSILLRERVLFIIVTIIS